MGPDNVICFFCLTSLSVTTVDGEVVPTHEGELGPCAAAANQDRQERIEEFYGWPAESDPS